MTSTVLKLKDYMALVEEGYIVDIKSFNETFITGRIEDKKITIISKNNTSSSIVVNIFYQLSNDYYDFISQVDINGQDSILITDGLMIFLNEENYY